MNKVIRLCALFALGFSLTAAPAAAADPLGSEFAVNTEIKNGFGTSVARLSGGGSVVVWTSAVGLHEEDANVYGQRLDDAGVPVGGIIRIHTFKTGTQSDPSVAALSNGGFVVAYVSYLQDGDGAGVYVRRFDETGKALARERAANTHTAGFQWAPKVAGLSNGGLVVVWHDTAPGENRSNVYVRRYDDAGKAVGAERLVTSSSTTRQAAPSVAALHDGGFVVIWSSLVIGQPNDEIELRGRRYDDAGKRIGREFVVNTGTVGKECCASVAALSGSGFVVVWQTSQSAEEADIYAQIYDAVGQRSGGEFRVNTTIPHRQASPSVVGLDDGGFVATWDTKRFSQDVPFGVFGQRYDNAGATVGSEFQVNTLEVNSQGKTAPAIGSLADGGFVVTWSRFWGGGFYVRAQRFAP